MTSLSFCASIASPLPFRQHEHEGSDPNFRPSLRQTDRAPVKEARAARRQRMHTKPTLRQQCTRLRQESREESLRQEGRLILVQQRQSKHRQVPRPTHENRGKAAREMRCISLPYCTFTQPNVTASPKMHLSSRVSTVSWLFGTEAHDHHSSINFPR